MNFDWQLRGWTDRCVGAEPMRMDEVRWRNVTYELIRVAYCAFTDDPIQFLNH